VYYAHMKLWNIQPRNRDGTASTCAGEDTDFLIQHELGDDLSISSAMARRFLGSSNPVFCINTVARAPCVIYS